MPTDLYTEKKQRLKYVASDFVAVSVAFLFFNLYRYETLPEIYVGTQGFKNYLGQSVLIYEQASVPFFSLALFWLSGYYNRPLNKSRLQELITTFFSVLCLAFMIFVMLLSGDGQESKIFEPLSIIIIFLIFFTFVYFGRLMITSVSIRHFRKNRIPANILIVGCSEKAVSTARQMQQSDSFREYNVEGFIRIPGENNKLGNMTEKVWEIDDLEVLCSGKKIGLVVISPEKRNETAVVRIIERLLEKNLSVKIASDTFSVVTAGISMNDIMANPYIGLTTPRMNDFSRNLKLSFDYLISMLLLVILSPLLLLSMLIIRITSPGPAVFRQERIGKNNRPFIMYKLRSMKTDAENDKPLLSSENDRRITRFGRTLRKYHIDEIPQFWNVLKGDMSIVGPRPERKYYIDKIKKEAPYYCLLSQVKPGITSWGMVKYGYASDVSQMIERSRYDLIYLNNMSISVDLKIMIYTVRAILTGTGK